jgi:eukaryotic-like serine/threonine-protein kinase
VNTGPINIAGAQLCGRFTLLEKIGAGGYGEVWRARDDLRETDIALKILYSQYQQSEAAWAAFQREFTLTARLNHPGVLRVYEPVRGPDAVVLPMVFASGGDLRQLRGASYTQILPKLIDIAAALEHAHARRIVHRDLKPSNILLDAAGRPMLADFGAGATEGDDTSGPPGSPFSASPQQLAGEPARPSDDIYGLGALTYELLSGYPPFYPTFDAKRITTEPVPRLRSVKPVPPRLELLVSWLLAKAARERPPTMRHVADELNAVLQDTLGLEGESEAEQVDTMMRDADALGVDVANLTPALTAEDEAPTTVRALEEIDERLIPRIDDGLEADKARRARRKRITLAIGAVSATVVVALAVLLPRIAEERRPIKPVSVAVPAIDPKVEELRKLSLALEKEHRELATRVLALDSRAAALWAGPDFAAARQALDEVAALLERKQAAQAQAPVEALKIKLTEIETRIPAALGSQLSEGKRALEAGEFENARQAYETALKIDVESEPAKQGLAKVAAASGVVPTLADAENALAAGDIPRATTLFNDVLKRNPGNRGATEGLKRLNAQVAETEFNTAMGAGLAALNAGRLSEARTQFERARRVRPDSPEVGAALQRVADAGSGRSDAELEQRATRLISEERWAEALAVYDEALARDPSLQFAQRGKEQVAPRAELGKRLQGLIEKPERLAADEVRSEAQRLIARAKALPSQGPVIRSQVARLELLLPTFNQPVLLALESDNVTEVAIQRVGFFGAFEKRQVELKPGRYTVTGRRSGYRDVRREITVAPGQSEQTVIIRCLEPI